MTKIRWYVGLLILLAFAVLVYPAISSFTNFVIHNTGKISTTTIWAKSGYCKDIQDAVNAVAAAGGGTVYIPEGDFDFGTINKTGPDNSPTGVVIPGGVSVIGAGIGKTILRVTERPPDGAYMFTIDGLNGKPTRISGISFIGYKFTEEDNPTTRGISEVGAADFRIDHCYFEDFCGAAISCKGHYGGVNRGVIDHCIIDNPYHDDPSVTGKDGGSKVWAYGVIVGGSGYEDSWYPDINTLLGHYDGLRNIVYIEDCNFSRCRHAVSGSSIGGGFYVVRYCRVSKPRYGGMLDVHGSWFSAPSVGGRGLEAYNNIIDGSDTGGKTFGSHFAFAIRGGGGVIYNNTIISCRDGAVALAREDANPICAVKDLWIWNNTLTNTSPLIGNYGNYTENVDYFLYAKPDYTPYPYPHPLTLQD